MGILPYLIVATMQHSSGKKAVLSDSLLISKQTDMLQLRKSGLFGLDRNCLKANSLVQPGGRSFPDKYPLIIQDAFES